MKKRSKTNIVLKATVVIAVALALVLPGSAVVTNTMKQSEPTFSFISENAIRQDINKIQRCNKVRPATTGSETDQIISGWWPGDDVLPSITEDPYGNIVVTYTNREDLSVSNWGITYNDDINSPDDWWNNGVILSLVGPSQIEYMDTCKLEFTYTGLFGVFLAMDTEEAGFYLIPDITADPSTWTDIYTWSGGAPEPQYAAVADGGWWQDLNYPDMTGPFNFYIYHEIYDIYDIVDCPICFHTDLLNMGGGVGYFDAQSEEITAPASDPDMVNLEDRFHTVVQYTDTILEEAYIVWKKIVPAEEPDYEYTPYQDTIAEGSNPAIAAYEPNHVAVVYMDGDNVNCIYSDDDGENWDASEIADGCFPDIFYDGERLLATYIYQNNLFLVRSTDGGATWSDPEQINDEDGTVVEEENSVDIYRYGIVWVDSRGADYDIYFEPLAAPEMPEIEITLTEGFGVGITATLENVGSADATNVEWGISLEGGIILIGKESSGTIDSLAVGESAEITTGLVLGIAKSDITVVSDYADDTTGSALVLLFLVKTTAN